MQNKPKEGLRAQQEPLPSPTPSDLVPLLVGWGLWSFFYWEEKAWKRPAGLNLAPADSKTMLFFSQVFIGGCGQLWGLRDGGGSRREGQ